MKQKKESQESSQITTQANSPLVAKSNILKAQFLKDMELAGLAPMSRKRYLGVVEQIIRYYWCSPGDITEEQVMEYLLIHHRRNIPKGTFKVLRFALRFFFGQTMGKDWHLFKKKCDHYLSSVYQESWNMPIAYS